MTEHSPIGWGPSPAFVLCHPDLVHQVLRDGRSYDKGGPFIDRVRQITGDGLVTSSYRQHRRQRRLVQPAFHHERLVGYAREMGRQIVSVTEGWSDRAGQVIDVLGELSEITTRVSTATMFAASLRPADAAAFRAALTFVIDSLYRRMLLPRRWERLPTPGNRRFTKAIATLDGTVYEIIDAYRRAGADSGDLLSMLLNAETDDGGFSDLELRDQVINFLTGGIETTATLLGWTFHPPAWLSTRTATAAVELAGQVIPAGTTLVFSPYLIHRRAGLYQDPDTFRPDRWLLPAAPRGAFVPFGGGARKCIGDSFAMVEATLALATIAQRWRLRPVPGLRVRPRPRASLRPYPLLMRLAKRPA